MARVKFYGTGDRTTRFNQGTDDSGSNCASANFTRRHACDKYWTYEYTDGIVHTEIPARYSIVIHRVSYIVKSISPLSRYYTFWCKVSRWNIETNCAIHNGGCCSVVQFGSRNSLNEKFFQFPAFECTVRNLHIRGFNIRSFVYSPRTKDEFICCWEVT